MILTILGINSAKPTADRHPSAHVLNVNERFYLIDCGEGTQKQMCRNRIPFSRLDHIFISHLHGDHVYGLFGLIDTFNLLGREKPLYIFAPQKLEKILLSHIADFNIVLNYKIIFTPLDGDTPRIVMENKSIVVTAFPLRHSVPTYGFVFREQKKERKMIPEAIEKYSIPFSHIPNIKKGADFITQLGQIIPNSELTLAPPPEKSYAYCSDTAYFSELSTMIKEVSCLYHEATYDNAHKDKAALYSHSTSLQAATQAIAIGAKLLLIGHFSSKYKDVTTLVDEAKSIFPSTMAAEEDKQYFL